MNIEDMWTPRPAVALSILAGCSILTTAVMHASWIIGAPLLVVLAATAFWSFLCIGESGMIPQQSPAIFAVTAPLTLAAVVSTGLAYTQGWELASVPFVLSLYSMILLLITLYPQEDGMMKTVNRVTSISCYLIVTSSVVALFVTDLLMPEYFATALLTTIFGGVALIVTECYASMFFGCIRVIYFLHLILMACYGVFIITGNSKSTQDLGFSIALITFCLQFALGFKHGLDDIDRKFERKAIPAVKQPQILVAVLIVTFVLMARFYSCENESYDTFQAGLITCFHFIHKAPPIAFPIILVSLDALHMLSLYIFWQFRAKIHNGLTAFLLLLLCVYLFSVSIHLKNRRNDGCLAVMMAAAIATVFFFHFFIMKITAREDIKKEHQLARNRRPAANAAIPNAVRQVVYHNDDSDYASDDAW